MIMRRKRRYVLVESSSSLDVSDRRNYDALRDGLCAFLGEPAFASLNLQFMRQVAQNAFILRVSRGTEQDLALALAFVKQVGERQIGMYTISTSGAIRALLEKAKRFY